MGNLNFHKFSLGLTAITVINDKAKSIIDSFQVRLQNLQKIIWNLAQVAGTPDLLLGLLEFQQNSER